MRFDIYGQFEIELIRENGYWVPYRTGNGVRRKEFALVIPLEITASEIGKYLDDMYHEYAKPGDVIRQLD